MWIRDISNKLNKKHLTEFLEFQDHSVGFVTDNQNQTQKARTIFHVLLVSVIQYLIIIVCDHYFFYFLDLFFMIKRLVLRFKSAFDMKKHQINVFFSAF